MKKKNRGFTIFFAALIATLALAIGVAIFDLTIREIDLSQTATQSHYAIYAADTGAECALYWDFKCSTGSENFCKWSGGSIFATSSGQGGGSPDTVSNDHMCNGIDISSSAATYTKDLGSSAATTTFNIDFATQGKTYCARVLVAKFGNPSRTKIISRGYNTCADGVGLRLERALQVSY